jgi:hypothetical protein
MPSLRRDYFLQMQEEREISHGEIARGNKKKKRGKKKKKGSPFRTSMRTSLLRF